MPSIVDQLRSPYGLSGGKILSGSVNTKADAFWYHPLTATSASIFFSNLGGNITDQNFGAGIGVYGQITMVSQSSGLAILYSGSYLPGTP